MVAGCSPAFDGVREPVDTTPLTAKQVFGDFSTIDYCGFFELGHSGLDGVRVLDERRDFDDCQLRVENSAGVSADVSIGELADESDSVLPREPDETVNHSRGLRIDRYDDIDPAACVHFLLFPDDISLQITASEEAAAKEDLCSITGVVADGVRRWVESGRPVTRMEFEPNSFGVVDACTTAAEEDVATALGVAAEARVPPSGHWCLWGRFDVQEPSAIVKFSLEDSLQEYADDRSAVIGGRDSVLRVEEPGSCLVLTQHMSAGQIAPGTVEIASVFVREVAAQDACSAARKLANVVWQSLPTG